MMINNITALTDENYLIKNFEILKENHVGSTVREILQYTQIE